MRQKQKRKDRQSPGVEPRTPRYQDTSGLMLWALLGICTLTNLVKTILSTFLIDIIVPVHAELNSYTLFASHITIGDKLRTPTLFVPYNRQEWLNCIVFRIFSFTFISSLVCVTFWHAILTVHLLSSFFYFIIGDKLHTSMIFVHCNVQTRIPKLCSFVHTRSAQLEVAHTHCIDLSDTVYIYSGKHSREKTFTNFKVL